ncbi:hypothetical protein HELRODRAFT_161608 [Helobdella robusta]|uniref:Reverse transcriptase domain-containing protein n=1 Tax=Helobdella robusta TaxID=6412 RepID=T1ERP6_HELRO|nr:hypothetical protein HELRODRAFT_161608 [Helobdella robusta]ESO02350.1 hypothetical protein HELRODRAFT_161608 [Helobdella robusta]
MGSRNALPERDGSRWTLSMALLVKKVPITSFFINIDRKTSACNFRCIDATELPHSRKYARDPSIKRKTSHLNIYIIRKNFESTFEPRSLLVSNENHVEEQTRGNNILDLVISSYDNHAQDVKFGEHILSSDHQIMRFKLKWEEPDQTVGVQRGWNLFLKMMYKLVLEYVSPYKEYIKKKKYRREDKLNTRHGESSGYCALNFAKAFDKVRHKGLALKLEATQETHSSAFLIGYKIDGKKLVVVKVSQTGAMFQAINCQLACLVRNTQNLKVECVYINN